MYTGINLFLISIPLGLRTSLLVPLQLLHSLKLESHGEILSLKAALHAWISSNYVKRIDIDTIKIHTRLLVFIIQEPLKKS